MKTVFLLILPAFLIFPGNLFAGEIIGSPVPKKTAKTLSNPTDFFRSFQTGDWGTLATWESSSDNSNWFAATLIPDNLASAITISNIHTVTVSTNQDMDEVSIESGGVLLHSGGTLTVNNGSAFDIVVQNGGIFTLANSSGPSFSAGATAFISPSGILRVAAGGLTGAGIGVNASNFTYSNASILEYTLAGSFSANGVTYFPNANAATIPIFRITSNAGVVGGSDDLTIKGLFEANANVTFQNSGLKIFRNGIIGTGTISSDAASGKFIINGDTAILGGSGSLTLPTAGMDIGSSTTVTMLSDKSVTGNIALLSNALIVLGNNNLTLTGTISGGSATSHIVTNTNGKLVINNIGTTPVFFPIGANTTSINQLEISNGNNINYGARVEVGINPSIRFPIAAVNRTWLVSVSANPAGPVNVNFYYSNGDGNALFNYTTNVEQGFYTGVWNVINTGLTQMGGPTNYQVNTIVSSFALNPSALMVIGNIPAILAPNNPITLHAQKQEEKTILNWSVANISTMDRFIAERSVDGRIYSVLMELPATGFSFTDMQPLPGLNYYRIKLIEKDGKITWSNIAVILNAAKGFDLINIVPNPIVNSNFKLNISAAQKMQIDIVITDMQGRLVQKRKANITAGFNTIPVNITNLAAGTYQVYTNTPDERSRVLRFVKQ